MGVTLGTAINSLYQRYFIPAYQETIIWLQMVRPDMSGATATTGRDTVRSQAVSYGDGSFGVGWRITDAAGVVRLGYMGGVPIQAAINDTALIQETSEAGLTVYETPLVSLATDPGLHKGDVLVYGNARYRVADRIKPFQAFGQTVLTRFKLEKHDPGSIIYSIPLI